MNCIIISSKSVFQNTMIGYVEKIPYLTLQDCTHSVFEAYGILQEKQIDLIFIDTHLPEISGIDFVRSLDSRPMFVFCSTDPSLAIEGYNVNALDFLLKPFSFDRFVRAANKAFEYYSLKRRQGIQGKNGSDSLPRPNEFILVKSEYQTIRIKLNEILYIEGLKDYIKIYTADKNKPVITLNSLKKLQHNLPDSNFSRVHKSYIIALNHISSINKTQVIIRDKYIPIGDSYKNTFLKQMEDRRI